MRCLLFLVIVADRNVLSKSRCKEYSDESRSYLLGEMVEQKAIRQERHSRAYPV